MKVKEGRHFCSSPFGLSLQSGVATAYYLSPNRETITEITTNNRRRNILVVLRFFLVNILRLLLFNITPFSKYIN